MRTIRAWFAWAASRVASLATRATVDRTNAVVAEPVRADVSALPHRPSTHTLDVPDEEHGGTRATLLASNGGGSCGSPSIRQPTLRPTIHSAAEVASAPDAATTG